ncbi:MAG: M48 family metallopeptidase [candidate division NC10 bacterium]|nr:M48 family metallopeptidase [candidate division NC10 bacterium]
MRVSFHHLAEHAFVSLLVLLAVLAGCATAPVTGRTQLLLIPEAQETSLGEKAFDQLVQKATRQGRLISSNDPNPTHRAAHAQIQAVLARLAPAADPERRYRWEYVLLNDPKTVNAGALPGGKIIIWSGLFQVTQTEAGLAVVLGHELGHVLAHHSAERISQERLTGLVSSAILRGVPDTQGGRLLAAALGLGTEVGILLPYSRLQESEADRIGLLLMAKAGYDPREAINLWQRMGALEKARPPVWLSTHPSPPQRIANLQGWMPEALRYYQNPALPLPGLAR